MKFESVSVELDVNSKLYSTDYLIYNILDCLAHEINLGR